MTARRKPSRWPAPPPGPDRQLQARVREAVDGLAERLQARLDDWGSLAERRRSVFGHHADCPNNGRQMRRCSWCRAQALARPEHTPAPASPPSPRSQPEPPAAPTAEAADELRACEACYRPTDHPSGRCDRCQPSGAPAGTPAITSHPEVS